MTKVLITIISVFMFTSILAEDAANDGMVNVKSKHSVQVAADRLVTILKKKGMTIFAQINHSEGAQSVGLTLRPTKLVIFGNPKVGTPLMLCGQSAAIDLPQKMLIWEDDKGIVWLSYNEPTYLTKRHGIKACESVVNKITNALAKISKAAAGE